MATKKNTCNTHLTYTDNHWKKIKYNILVFLFFLLPLLPFAAKYCNTVIQDSVIPAYLYYKAEAAVNNGNIQEAAMLFGRCGAYSDASQRSHELWNQFVKHDTIAVDCSQVAGIHSSGSVISEDLYYTYQNDQLSTLFEFWTDMVDIDTDGTYTAALRADGTVWVNGFQTSSHCYWARNWTDIVDIAISNRTVFGLKTDGTVISSTESLKFPWTDIIAIDYGGCYIGLKSNGTVEVRNQLNRLVTYDSSSGWNDIVDVAAGSDHVVGLRADGTVIAAGENKFGQCDVSQWTDIVAISAGDRYTVGLKYDGTAVATGDNNNGQCNISGWIDLVAVSAGENHTVAVKSNGKVTSTSGILKKADWDHCKLPDTIPTNPDLMKQSSNQKEALYVKAKKLESDGKLYEAAVAFGQLQYYEDSWQRTRALWDQILRKETFAINIRHAVGITTNNTLLSVAPSWMEVSNVSHLTEVTEVACGWGFTLALHSNGGISFICDKQAGYLDFTGWDQIVSVSAGPFGAIGVKEDGTVLQAGVFRPQDVEDLNHWSNIVKVSMSPVAPYSGIVGLKTDGTIVALGSNNVPALSKWENLIDVAVGDSFIVGLRADGTVLAEGKNDYGQCNVSHWRDIIAISAGPNHTVGLKKNGIVVATGDNSSGQLNISDWTLIRDVVASENITVGIQFDGTLVYAGAPDPDCASVGSWENLMVSDPVIDDSLHEFILQAQEAEAEKAYIAAEALLADGKKGAAAIAFAKISPFFKDAEQRSFALWNEITLHSAVAAGSYHTLGLKKTALWWQPVQIMITANLYPVGPISSVLRPACRILPV